MLDIILISVILAIVLAVCGCKAWRIIKGRGGGCAGCSGCLRKDDCPESGGDIT